MKTPEALTTHESDGQTITNVKFEARVWVAARLPETPRAETKRTLRSMEAIP